MRFKVVVVERLPAISDALSENAFGPRASETSRNANLPSIAAFMVRDELATPRITVLSGSAVPESVIWTPFVIAFSSAASPTTAARGEDMRGARDGVVSMMIGCVVLPKSFRLSETRHKTGYVPSFVNSGNATENVASELPAPVIFAIVHFFPLSRLYSTPVMVGRDERFGASARPTIVTGELLETVFRPFSNLKNGSVLRTVKLRMSEYAFARPSSTMMRTIYFPSSTSVVSHARRFVGTSLKRIHSFCVEDADSVETKSFAEMI